LSFKKSCDFDPLKKITKPFFKFCICISFGLSR